MQDESVVEDSQEEIDQLNTFISRVVNGLSVENLKALGAIERPSGFYVKLGASSELKVEMLGGRKMVQPDEYKEPLLDVLLEKDFVRVVAELRGIRKDRINVLAKAEELNINASSDDSSYNRIVNMPCLVDPITAKAKYNNGLLEITAKRVSTAKTYVVPIE